MSKRLQFIASVSKVCLLVKRDNVIRGLCTFGCGNDRSLYIWPFSRRGQYFYGSQLLASGTTEKSFPFHVQEQHTGKRPHLSLHESGAVRIRAGRIVAGPLTIPRLDSLRGEHTATVRADRIDDLPVFNAKMVTKGEKCCLMPLDASAESVKAIVYINGKRPNFARDQHVTFQLPGNGNAIWIGVTVVDDKAIGSGPTSEGITVISGWDPTTARLAQQEFLFLRSV